MTKRERGFKKVKVDVVEDFGSNPFSSLDTEGLPAVKEISPRSASPSVDHFSKGPKVDPEDKIGQGQRLEIRREKSGRGGKTVTTITGFPSTISQPQKNQLLKRIKKSIGTGGCWNEGVMELQGDRRNQIFEWLHTIGYKPVFAGG